MTEYSPKRTSFSQPWEEDSFSTPLQYAVKKISISVKGEVWRRLQSVKNKSAVINQALELYFDRQDYMEMAWEMRVAEQIQQNPHKQKR